MFADVTIPMRATEKERVVWDTGSAVRCALPLFNNSDITPTHLQREALLAIIANSESHRHPDLTSALFEFADRYFGDVKKSTHFYRDVVTTVRVFLQTSSLSARRQSFRVILRVAVDDTLAASEGSWTRPDDVEEPTVWLMAILEAHDAGNAFPLRKHRMRNQRFGHVQRNFIFVMHTRWTQNGVVSPSKYTQMKLCYRVNPTLFENDGEIFVTP